MARVIEAMKVPTSVWIGPIAFMLFFTDVSDGAELSFLGTVLIVYLSMVAAKFAHDTYQQKRQ